jgi:hypothetical protein
MLDRGAEVRGVVVAGEDPRYRWLKITEGPYAGYFVTAERSLSRSPRAALDTSIEGSLTAHQSGPIYGEPDRYSEVIQEVEPGLELTVLGRVGGGLVEVSLRNGGIGYVEEWVFKSSSSEAYNPAPERQIQPRINGSGTPQQTDRHQPHDLGSTTADELDQEWLDHAIGRRPSRPAPDRVPTPARRQSPPGFGQDRQ